MIIRAKGLIYPLLVTFILVVDEVDKSEKWTIFIVDLVAERIQKMRLFVTVVESVLIIQ